MRDEAHWQAWLREFDLEARVSLIAAILFAATFNGCPLQSMTYTPPLEIHACNQVYVSPHPGLVVYTAAVLTVPGGYVEDRVFASGFGP